MCYKVSNALLSSVKSNVDIIYEFTKDGYSGSFSSLHNSSLMKVLAEVIKCGAVVKTRNKKAFEFRWAASTPPTERFYINIAGKIGSHQRELDKRKRRAPEVKPVVESAKALSDYTLAELWAEMQSRGAIIKDNHIVVIKTEVIG